MRFSVSFHCLRSLDEMTLNAAPRLLDPIEEASESMGKTRFNRKILLRRVIEKRNAVCAWNVASSGELLVCAPVPHLPLSEEQVDAHIGAAHCLGARGEELEDTRDLFSRCPTQP
jgi:hypothetical protein